MGRLLRTASADLGKSKAASMLTGTCDIRWLSALKRSQSDLEAGPNKAQRGESSAEFVDNMHTTSFFSERGD